MKKILCIIRTSSMEQETESQHNDMLRFLTEERGLGYSEEEIEWLEVAGASARSVNEKYLQMLETIKATITNTPTIKAVALWHINRLGRKEKYIVLMKDWFIEHKIQVYIKNPNITLLDENGEVDKGNSILWGVFGSMVEAETDEMMAKTKRGKELLKEKGLYIGGKLTYGYMIGEDKKIVPDLEQMKVVKLIYEEYSTGKYSMAKLGKELLQRGYKFRENLLQSILSREMYIPFVGQELYDKVKAVRGNNITICNTKEHKNKVLGLKVFKCQCGGSYMYNSGHYQCYRRKRRDIYIDGRRCSVDSPMPSVDVVDTLVWDFAANLYCSYLFQVDKESAEKQKKDKAVLLQKLNNFENSIIKSKNAFERAKNLYMDGDITKAEYDKKKASNTSEINRLQAAIDDANKEVSRIDSIINDLENPDLQKELQVKESIGKMEDRDKMREIILQQVKVVTCCYTTFNNRQSILFTLTGHNGDVWKVIYDYNGAKGKDCTIFDRLYFIEEDGTFMLYSPTKQPLCKLLWTDKEFMRDFLYKQMITLRK